MTTLGEAERYDRLRTFLLGMTRLPVDTHDTMLVRRLTERQQLAELFEQAEQHIIGEAQIGPLWAAAKFEDVGWPWDDLAEPIQRVVLDLIHEVLQLRVLVNTVAAGTSHQRKVSEELIHALTGELGKLRMLAESRAQELLALRRQYRGEWPAEDGPTADSTVPTEAQEASDASE